ncbi:MAG: peptide chain release factor N(5)-glutamine methyltransferase [bacterium]|nr:peptide chain release factor N(5)-glutamine methyltransferase [bacterium]
MNTNSSVKINNWRKNAISELKSDGVSSADLDCWLLLEKVVDKPRSHLMAHEEIELSTDQIQELDGMLADRIKHKPMAYILGEIEFYGEKFFVDERVLVPRPETETMIDMLKDLKPNALIDVGTGSGAIAIIAKKLFPSKEVIAIDNDPKCLEVAKINAKKHGSNIVMKKNDLLEGLAILDGMVILANLPYVPDDFGINKAALNEPHQAIFGGKDGLDLYRKLFAQLKRKAVIVLTESMPPQHKKLDQIAKNNGFEQTKESDFIQQFEPIA